MTNAQLWALLVGALAPPFIAIVQQPTWSKPVRSAVTVFICLFLGTATAYVNGDLAGRSVTTTILLCLVAAWSSYGRFWKPTGLAGAVEEATSPAGDDLDPIALGRQGRPDGLPDTGSAVDYPPDVPGPENGPQAPGPASRDL